MEHIIELEFSISFFIFISEDENNINLNEFGENTNRKPNSSKIDIHYQAMSRFIRNHIYFNLPKNFFLYLRRLNT